MADAGLIVLTAFISPHRAERQLVKERVGHDRFIEIYVNTPLAICEQRDPKGLYKKRVRASCVTLPASTPFTKRLTRHRFILMVNN